MNTIIHKGTAPAVTGGLLSHLHCTELNCITVQCSELLTDSLKPLQRGSIAARKFWQNLSQVSRSFTTIYTILSQTGYKNYCTSPLLESFCKSHFLVGILPLRLVLAGKFSQKFVRQENFQFVLPFWKFSTKYCFFWKILTKILLCSKIATKIALRWKFYQNISFIALTVWEIQYFEDASTKDD